jgi:hypothetical protein
MSALHESGGATDDPHGIGLRLSAQRALVGNVPGSLRSVSVEYRGTDIACRFIFDGEPSEEDQELLTCAATEIIADFKEPYTISEEYLAVPCPGEMTYLRHVVFKRHEAYAAA